MYSPAACPPCQAKITPVNATPMLIHTADSMAASLVVGACGLRWTSSRSTTSSTVTNARNATQIQTGTSKLAKLLVGRRGLGRQHGDGRQGHTQLPPAGVPDGDFQPKVSPATRAVDSPGRAAHAPPVGRTDDDHVEGYSPSVRCSVPARRRVPNRREGRSCPSGRCRPGSAAPTMAWAAASRATGTRNGRARHVVEPDPLEERDRRGVAAVLAAHAQLELAVRRAAPARRRCSTRSPTPSASMVSNGLRRSRPCSR